MFEGEIVLGRGACTLPFVLAAPDQLSSPANTMHASSAQAISHRLSIVYGNSQDTDRAHSVLEHSKNCTAVLQKSHIES